MFYVDETGISQPTDILRDGLGPVAEVKLSTTTFTKGGPELGQIKITRPPNASPFNAMHKARKYNLLQFEIWLYI